MKKLLSCLLFAALAVTGFGQTQNVQAASGVNPDITRPAAGFNFPNAFTLNVKTGATISGAGSYDFSAGTKLVVPNSAAPTTTSFGWLAADNNAWAASRGALQFFDGTANTYVLAALASSTPANGYIPTWQTGGTIIWTAPPSGTTANPSATIGLTAVNGVASTLMASDSAPALSQAIAPTWTGVHIFTPAARSSGVLPYFKINAPADTALTAGTSAPGFQIAGATRQHASTTTVTDQDEIQIDAPTYSFASATGTITNASTLTVTAAPVVGTNAAITNPFALRLKAGNFGMGATGAIASLSQTSGLLTINSVNGINIRPANGITSIAGATTDLVISDSAATPTWQGIATGHALELQSNAASSRLALLSVNGGDSVIEGEACGGTYGALTATPTTTRTRIIYRTYGGSTWVAAANIFLTTTQAQTESARGTQINFSTTPNNAIAAVGVLTLDQDGSVKALVPTGGLGYATGAGGAVTQATNRTTGVTLNTVTGAITTNNTSLAALAAASFTVTDSAVAVTDTIVLSIRSGQTNAQTMVYVTTVAAGSFQITVNNGNAVTAETGTIIINFAVIKAVSS